MRRLELASSSDCSMAVVSRVAGGPPEGELGPIWISAGGGGLGRRGELGANDMFEAGEAEAAQAQVGRWCDEVSRTECLLGGYLGQVQETRMALDRCILRRELGTCMQKWRRGKQRLNGVAISLPMHDTLNRSLSHIIPSKDITTTHHPRCFFPLLSKTFF